MAVLMILMEMFNAPIFHADASKDHLYRQRSRHPRL